MEVCGGGNMRMKYLIVIALLLSFLAWTPDVAQAAVRHYRRRYRHGYVVRRRSKKKQAAIIGGSALAGAGVGALAGGKKGAAIGAGVGGAGGTAYDLKTRKKKVYK
jgi:hypothetical protein